jgi:hypothetical protein
MRTFILESIPFLRGVLQQELTFCSFTGFWADSMRKISIKVFVFFNCLLLNQGTAFSQAADPGLPAGIVMGLSPDDLSVCLLPPVNSRGMQKEDSLNDLQKASFRFGYNQPVNYTPLNSGTWTSLPNGDRIWRIRIRSAGAQSLNVGFSDYQLPEGARIFVFSPGLDQVLGAFSARHNHPDRQMGTDLISGEEIVVEYDEPMAVRGQGTFCIFRITHGYRSFNYLRSFGQSGTCIPNVNCPEGNSWSNQRRSVVCLVSNGNEFSSGALVNNTSNDGTPYVLTANHVGVPSGSWVFRFNWEVPGCANPSVSPSVTQSVSGAIPIAQNSGSDFSLCKMAALPPASFQVFYAGWSALNSPADSVCAIHHPSGDIKKISLAANPVTTALWNGAEVWKIGLWTDGCTESGSSGSPLFDQSRRIVGQLFGGPSGCGVQTSQDFDYYGKFAVSWNTDTLASGRLRDWLDPGNTGALTNDGYDPNNLMVSERGSEAFELFPNPVKDILNVVPASNPASLTIDIVNSQGQRVFSKTASPQQDHVFQFVLGGLARGFYLIELKTAGAVIARKLILN